MTTTPYPLRTPTDLKTGQYLRGKRGYYLVRHIASVGGRVTLDACALNFSTTPPTLVPGGHWVSRHASELCEINGWTIHIQASAKLSIAGLLQTAGLLSFIVSAYTGRGLSVVIGLVRGWS